jgi:outer membrane biogenesis lipoprotein LolB
MKHLSITLAKLLFVFLLLTICLTFSTKTVAQPGQWVWEAGPDSLASLGNYGVMGFRQLAICLRQE